MSEVTIEPITANEATQLLIACELPVKDISPAAPLQFFGVRANSGELVAVIGLELYAPVGLLRSLAVAPAQRCHGLAHALVAHAEAIAGRNEIATLFLLTTTAAGFFAKLGYAVTVRDEAPAAIQTTSQFAGLCPSSATLMSRRIAAAPRNA